MRILVMLFCLLAIPAALLAETAERIGTVSALQGTATAKQGTAAPRALAVRAPLYRNDVITTAAGSRVALLFTDMTIFTLGPSTTLGISQYLTNRSAEFTLQRGTFRMVSGEIARRNPEGFNMRSPSATIGIRGTTTGHEISDNGEQHYVLDMAPGHQVIIGGQQSGIPPVTVTVDLTVVSVTPDGSIGGQQAITPQQADAFSAQFVFDNPRAYLPPPPGTPPPPVDENGNPLPPPPDGTLLPPPDGTYLPPPPDGTYLPPPPDGTYLTGTYLPPPDGTLLPPPPGGTYLPPPDGTLPPPPPGTFPPLAPTVTGDQIVTQVSLPPYYPTHMAGVMLFYNTAGNSFTPGGVFATAGIVTNGSSPTFTGGAGSVTTGTSIDAITGITQSPSYNWSGTAYGHKVVSGGIMLPGTQQRYMEWGDWVLNDPAYTFVSTADLRLAAAHWIDGVKTPDLRLSELGAQSVTGHYTGGARGTYMQSGGSPQSISGTFVCDVNFNTNQVTNTVISFPSPSITLSQAAAAALSAGGTFSISSLSVTMPGGTASGKIDGACFGPNAEGVGGNFAATSAADNAIGTFSATR